MLLIPANGVFFYSLIATVVVLQTCRTLLQLIKHATRPKCLEKNLDLVYCILLEEQNFEKICNCKRACTF